ncbi:WxL protein host-binding domain-containing protein [Chryseobacterium sp.]|uniref:WxL protein host-binding domain-containing protein n=1 Tax=Chryseobacterium sp. TaxID=1871047 RepID=UPI002896A58E|nr:DUF3324 domain-containing protein [Chryseobacterium sp.]
MLKRIFLVLSVLFSFIFTKANIIIVNGLTHHHKTSKGQTVKGKITIENIGNTTENVKIFLQDYSYVADGSINYSKPGEKPQTNATWTKLNADLITLKAKEKKDVFYEVSVPAENIKSASYWSVVIVEPVEDIKPSDEKQGISITSIVRYAIQLVTDVDAENAKVDLKFESIKFEKENNAKLLKIALSNTGELFCKPSLIAEIYAKDGTKIGVFKSQTMSLLPNNSKTFYIDVSKLKAKNYNAVVIATDEDENAFAVNVDFEVKDE